MPVTMICFIISGLAISGVPPFNGFFSKELIFDAALESNGIFYIGALLGAFLTAISFLKLGRAAFSGTFRLPEGKKTVRESSFGMLLPMGILAAVCIIFGVANTLPLDRIIGPALALEESFSGWPHSLLLVMISILVLLLALGDHLYGSRKSGGAINAADHIHYAPVLKNIYKAAEKQWFDPYQWTLYAVTAFSTVCVYIEKGVSWFYDIGVVAVVKGAGNLLRRFNTGSLARYLIVALSGVAGILIIFLAILL
jgi:NADH-quinone oxidoreductase subunit L